MDETHRSRRRILPVTLAALLLLLCLAGLRISSNRVYSIRQTDLTQSAALSACSELAFSEAELSALRSVSTLSEVAEAQNDRQEAVALDPALAQALFAEILPDLAVKDLSVIGQMLIMDVQRGGNRQILTWHPDGFTKTVAPDASLGGDTPKVVYENRGNETYVKNVSYLDLWLSLRGA